MEIRTFEFPDKKTHRWQQTVEAFGCERKLNAVLVTSSIPICSTFVAKNLLVMIYSWLFQKSGCHNFLCNFTIYIYNLRSMSINSPELLTQFLYLSHRLIGERVSHVGQAKTNQVNGIASTTGLHNIQTGWRIEYLSVDIKFLNLISCGFKPKYMLTSKVYLVYSLKIYLKI